MENQNENLETIEDIVSILKEKGFQTHDNINYYYTLWLDPLSFEDVFTLYVDPTNKIISFYLASNSYSHNDVIDFTDFSFDEAYESAFRWMRYLTNNHTKN